MLGHTWDAGSVCLALPAPSPYRLISSPITVPLNLKLQMPTSAHLQSPAPKQHLLSWLTVIRPSLLYTPTSDSDHCSSVSCGPWEHKTRPSNTKKFLRASRKSHLLHSHMGKINGLLRPTLTFQFLLVQSNGIFLQSKHVVSKDNNLVIPPFMKLDQKLASSEFVGIHGVEQDPFLGFDCHVLPVELRRHWAPNLWNGKNQGSVCKFKHHTTENFGKSALEQTKTKPMACELHLKTTVNTHSTKQNLRPNAELRPSYTLVATI